MNRFIRLGNRITEMPKFQYDTITNLFFDFRQLAQRAKMKLVKIDPIPRKNA